MNFASDNVAACHPAIFDAAARVNAGPARPYGADEATARVKRLVSEVFEREVWVHLVATGTAANGLALACVAPPWSAIWCHDVAHVEVDECGAPEFYTGGAKLVTVGGGRAKIEPEALEAAARKTPAGFVHNVQPGALSLTQATELGGVYRPEEIARLAEIARTKGAAVHMDGTRFGNAVARLGCAPADLTWRAGVDVLCLGATKGGAMAAEAVIFFDEAKSWEFELRRKRAGHLWSKMRFMAAQMEAFLTDGLWLKLAANANAMADRLAEGLSALPGVELPEAPEANMLFPRMPRRAHRRLMEAGAVYYPWPHEASLEGPAEAQVGCRLVCSWATTEREVDDFLAATRAALRANAA